MCHCGIGRFNRLIIGLFGLAMIAGLDGPPRRAQAQTGSLPSITLSSTSTGLKPLFNVLAKIYAEIGLQAVDEVLPAARLNQAAMAGALDAILVVSEGFHTALAEHYLAMGLGNGPLGTSNLCMYVRKGDEARFKPDPGTWKGRSIGVIVSVGPTMTDTYLKNLQGITIITAPSYQTLLRMLDGSRFDFILTTQGAVEVDIESMQLKGRIVRQDKVLMVLNYYHALNKRYSAKAPELERALLRHRAEIDQAIDVLINR